MPKTSVDVVFNHKWTATVQPRKLKTLTIVAPFYNEEPGANTFYETLIRVLDAREFVIDMVFVDDSSQDNTLAILNAIADYDPRVTVVSLSRNFGHQIALTAGIDYASGEAIVVMDSDLQHPPEAVLEMIARYEEGYDVIYGVRANTDQINFLKRTTSSLYYTLMRQMTNIEVIRGAADFRLMSADVVQSLRQMRELHRYLRGMVPWVGFRSAQVVYRQPERFAGQPGYTWRKSLKLARHGLFSFSTIPLELITWLGIFMTGVSMLYLIYTLGVAASGEAIPGWTSTIVVSLAIGGVQLISLGILAQYIGMIFEQVKDRPLYFVKQLRLAQDRLAENEATETQSEAKPHS